VFLLPIYEYACLSCGKHIEKMQKITEDPLSSCPFCAGMVKKLVSNCSFQLKGSGWYVTDYAKKSEKKEGKKKDKKEGKDKKSDTGKEIAKTKETPKEKAVNQ
jgi:putative FmdB family regulatory protein